MTLFTNATFDLDPVLNVSSVSGFVVEVNNLVNGWFGICLIGSVFLLVFITLRVSRKEIGNGECFADSVFVSMIVTLLCWGLGIVSSKVFFIMVCLTAVTVYLIIAHGRSQDSE